MLYEKVIIHTIPHSKQRETEQSNSFEKKLALVM